MQTIQNETNQEEQEHPGGTNDLVKCRRRDI